MSTHDLDVDRIAFGWLAEGPTELSDRVLEASLAQIHYTPQRRASSVPWRFHDMPSVFKLALAGAAVVAVLVVGSGLLTRGPSANVGGPGTATSPSAATTSPSPVPTASPTMPMPTDTLAWTTFTSTQYGFRIGHPDDWTVRPASRAWELATDAADWLSPATDDFKSPTGDARVSAWSVPLDPGTIVDETWAEVEAWVEQQYCDSAGGTSCARKVDEAVRLCVEVRDCHPGILVEGPAGEVQAFFTGGGYGGGMTVVTVWREELHPSVARYGGARQLLEGFLAPMCVWPEAERPAPGEASC